MFRTQGEWTWPVPGSGTHSTRPQLPSPAPQFLLCCPLCAWAGTCGAPGCFPGSGCSWGTGGALLSGSVGGQVLGTLQAVPSKGACPAPQMAATSRCLSLLLLCACVALLLRGAQGAPLEPVYPGDNATPEQMAQYAAEMRRYINMLTRPRWARGRGPWLPVFFPVTRPLPPSVTSRQPGGGHPKANRAVSWHRPAPLSRVLPQVREERRGGHAGPPGMAPAARRCPRWVSSPICPGSPWLWGDRGAGQSSEGTGLSHCQARPLLTGS